MQALAKVPKDIRKMVVGCLSVYRVDLELIELMRRTLAGHLDDAAGLLEAEEELAKLPLLARGGNPSMSLAPTFVIFDETMVDVRLKIEEPGDAEEYERVLGAVKGRGVSVSYDQADVEHVLDISGYDRLLQGFGLLMYLVKFCFGLWTDAGLLRRLVELDPAILNLKDETAEGAPTGRLWFREGVVLRAQPLLIHKKD